MAKAMIVFADGSKRMAHNLDDLNFRWYERKTGQVEELEGASRQGIAFHYLTGEQLQDVPLQQLLDIRAELGAQYQTCLIELKMLKERCPEYEYRRRSLQLEGARVEIAKQLKLLKPAIAHASQHQRETKSKEYKRRLREDNERLQCELLDAQSEIIRLQRIIIEHLGISTEAQPHDPA